MKKIYLILFLILLPQIARATYIQSGKHDFATAGSSACSPNSGSGSVTSGNEEIMTVQANTSTAVTISSTRVTTWTLDQDFSNSGHVYLWHGTVTSSGVETVTVSFTSGTALIGSMCGEYSNNGLDSTCSGTTSCSVTTTHAVVTIVGGASCGVGCALDATMTLRQSCLSGGTAFFVYGDVNKSSTGTYTITMNGGSAARSVVDALIGGALSNGVPRHR